MKALLAIALREIRDRWLLLAGAVLMGILPWLFYGGFATFSAVAPGSREGTAVLVVILAGFYVPAVAVIAGWSAVGRDLSEGRLGFFFARPIPWWAIWGGKWLAGVVLTLASALVMWLFVAPLVPGGMSKMAVWLIGGTAAFFAVTCLLLMAMSHIASIAFRSRSPLLVLDLALALITPWAFVWLGIPFLVAGSFFGVNSKGWFGAVGVGVVAGLFTLAGAVQVAVGRIDKRRGHRAMSLTLWSGVAVLLLFVGVRSYQVTHLDLVDLSEILSVRGAPHGEWVEASGWTKSHRIQASVLLDVATDRTIRRPVFPMPSATAFSDDGRRAAWLETAWLETAGPFHAFRLLRDDVTWDRLVAAHLDGSGRAVTRIALGVPVRFHWMLGLALSPDGKRLAVASGSMLDVFDVTSGRQITAVPSGGGKWTGPMRFIDDSKLHVYRRAKDARPLNAITMELVEVDSNTRSSTVPLGRLSLAEGERITQTLADGRLLVVTHESGLTRGARNLEPQTVRVHEGSGRLVTSVSRPSGRISGALLLEDGRVALLAADDVGVGALDLHAPDGSLLWHLPFEGPHRGGRIGGVLPSDRLTVTTGHHLLPGSTSTSVVSLATGAVLHTHDDATVIGQRWWNNSTTRQPVEARLLSTPGGGLVLLDEKGETSRTILKSSKDR